MSHPLRGSRFQHFAQAPPPPRRRSRPLSGLARALSHEQQQQEPVLFIETSTRKKSVAQYRFSREGQLLSTSEVHTSGKEEDSGTAGLREFFLPPGWPQTVSDDFLPYVLWGVPTHIFGWVMHSMTTASLLKAVGSEPGTAAVAAASAAIKWLSRDGIGALGRLLVGGRLGAQPDVDPKMLRIYADLLGLLGSSLELATAFMPQNFLLLASSGSALRTVGKGLSGPAHRAFSAHFARDNNIGAVCAKEARPPTRTHIFPHAFLHSCRPTHPTPVFPRERHPNRSRSWFAGRQELFEVAAELCGLAASVAILRAGATETDSRILLTWGCSALLHLACRYAAVASLRFTSLNVKRAMVLARTSVREGRVLSVEELRRREPILIPPPLLRPRLRLGCSLADALAASLPHGAAAAAASAAAETARYVVTRGEGGACWVALEKRANAEDCLAAIWVAAALEEGPAMAAEGPAAEARARAFVEEVLGLGMTLELLLKETAAQPRFEVARS